MIAVGAWLPVSSADHRARALYLRHYSSEKRPRAALHVGRHPNSDRFVGPGSPLVLLTLAADAVFAWRRSDYRADGQSGIECVIFRNEGPLLSSTLIREADDLAWSKWPGDRHFTFVNPRKVRSTNPGYCFLQAGWRRLEHRTKGGLVVLEKLP